MLHLHRTLWFASFVIYLGFTPVLLAQKGGKPRASHQHGTAVFRSDGPAWQNAADANPCGEAVPDKTDAITGDGSGYPGTGDIASGSGAFLVSGSNEFWLLLRGGGSEVYIDFSKQAVAPTGAGRKNFCHATLDRFEFHTNVIDPSTWQDSDGGLLAIPEGGAWPARIKAFWTDSYGVTYVIRFNPDHYPGSNYAMVTRRGEKLWTIEAGTAEAGGLGDVAQLLSLLEGQHGKPGSTLVDEGFYHLPFQITFTIP